MIEKQSIKGIDVWLEVQPFHIHRDNPNVIPTEYFTAKYYLRAPDITPGEMITEKDGKPKLFESPVAALEFANEKLMEVIET